MFAPIRAKKIRWLAPAILILILIGISTRSIYAQSTNPAKPDAYTLQGDSSNSGSGETYFDTSSPDYFGGWQFSTSGTDGTAIGSYCVSGDYCWGAYLSGRSVGVEAVGNNSGSAIAGTGVAGYGYSGDGSGNGNGDGVYGYGYSDAGGVSYGVYGFADGVDDSVQQIGVYGYGLTYGGVFSAGYNSAGVEAFAGGAGYGVIGYGAANGSNVGVYGNSTDTFGVVGDTAGSNSSSTIVAGVYGSNGNFNSGPSSRNAGVYGFCGNCSGVIGETSSGVGIRGVSSGPSSSYAGFYSATQGVGLYATSNAGIGIYGKTNTSYGVTGVSNTGYGVYGKSTSANGVLGVSTSSTGVRGISTSYFGFYAGSTSGYGGYAYTTSGTAAFRAYTASPTTPGHYAIIADGDVRVNGNLTCTGSCLAAMGVKTDAGERFFYAEGSTASRLSDAGTAMLKDGQAVVKIDPLFAQATNLGAGYQVFLTPRSANTAGLAVVNTSGGSFEVRELLSGKASFAFDWRIEALRRGYEAVRMAPVPTVAAVDQMKNEQLDIPTTDAADAKVGPSLAAPISLPQLPKLPTNTNKPSLGDKDGKGKSTLPVK